MGVKLTMKFLPINFEEKNIIPLNIYYTPGENGKFNDDTVDIIFKDLDTQTKHVCIIHNPMIEIWIVKEEYRNYTHIKNFIDKKECYPVKVHYKTRFYEIGKILGIPTKDVKYSPYIAQIDMEIEHFYMLEFIKEYHTDAPKKLNIGYLDIETDIITLNRFPEPGEVPINCVTYICNRTSDVYTFILGKDGLPSLPEGHKNYKEVYQMKEEFYDQIEKFSKSTKEFIQECHEKFDESYGELTYHLFIYDKEEDLIKAVFGIIKACDDDFINIWNKPFDISNLITRPQELGMDIRELIMDAEFLADEEEGAKNGIFYNRKIYFKEDTNAMVHKRKHITRTFTLQTFVCQMRLYAGIRIGRGKLPSVRLNYIAQRELKDNKLDYSEEGNMRFFPYRNFRKFVLYNIKDVLLQKGIGDKTQDMATIYSIMYDSGILISEVFTTTTMLLNSLRLFVFNLRDGYLIGTNKNKFSKDTITDYEKVLAEYFAASKYIHGENQDEDDDNLSGEEFYEEDFIDLSEYDEGDSGQEDEKGKKKKKYQGAIVMSPEHMSSSGFKLLGTINKFIHDLVIDMDITSEYPSAIKITNASNDTLVGRVFFKDPASIKIPIYAEFNMTPDEKKSYKMDPGAFFIDTLAQDNPQVLGSIFLDLPRISEIVKILRNKNLIRG